MIAGTCTACGRRWAGAHRCGERHEEAEARARIAAMEDENAQLRAAVAAAQRRPVEA